MLPQIIAGIVNTLVTRTVNFVTSRDGQPGLSGEDIKIVVAWIKEAETKFDTGAKRRAAVMRAIKKVPAYAATHVAEYLFWTALNVADKQGVIKLGAKNAS